MPGSTEGRREGGSVSTSGGVAGAVSHVFRIVGVAVQSVAEWSFTFDQIQFGAVSHTLLGDLTPLPGPLAVRGVRKGARRSGKERIHEVGMVGLRL